MGWFRFETGRGRISCGVRNLSSKVKDRSIMDVSDGCLIISPK